MYIKNESSHLNVFSRLSNQYQSSFERKRNMKPRSKDRSSTNCWDEWCCPGRCGVFTPILVGALLAFSILAFFFSLWAWQSSLYVGSQHVYTGAVARITPDRYAHVLAATVPMMVVLPNNLIEYIGGIYSIDCASPLGHRIELQNGLLQTTWDGNNTVATCIAGTHNAGLLFRVFSQNGIRLLQANGIAFSTF